MVELPLREQADGEVDPVGVELVQDPGPVDRAQQQPDAGRVPAELRDQARPEQRLDAVRKAHREGARDRGRIELLLPVHQRLHLPEGAAQRLGDPEGAGRRPHPVRRPGQELVVEQAAQAGEARTHRRLADPDARGGPRDAPLVEQRVEGDQQVQVDPAEIDMVDGHGRRVRWGFGRPT
ncbi:hypothetical protein SR39_12220 [Methylobacterium radiotolerans]|nr:hypothetical protein SR39_12220 [Methylobacterium radiotolerans]